MRTIPDPGFSGDDGSASPELAAALAAYAADPDSGYAGVVALLPATRLLVPVVAVLGEVEHDEHGRPRDKTSDMATVLLQGRDGRLALLAFTCADAMQRWDPKARPTPARGRQVAEAAVQDGASAILVDVAGPVTFVLEEAEVRAVAEGFRLARVGEDLAWVRQA